MTKQSGVKVGFFVPEEVREEFKELCQAKGSSLSTELRMYMIQTVNDNYNQKSKVQ